MLPLEWGGRVAARLGVGKGFRGKIVVPEKQILTKHLLPWIVTTLTVHHHIRGRTRKKRVRWLLEVAEQLEQAMGLKLESMFDRISDKPAPLATSVETSRTFRCQKKTRYRHELAYNSPLKNLKSPILSHLTLIVVSCSFFKLKAFLLIFLFWFWIGRSHNVGNPTIGSKLAAGSDPENGISRRMSV